ncbi:unnamed protein product [Laminaria digitata]
MTQSFVGLTTLLAAFSPCFAAGDLDEVRATQPLLSGRV